MEKAFQGISDPGLLDEWWTKSSSGKPEMDSVYKLHFGKGYDWEANVISINPPREFALRFSVADKDWMGTILHFELSEVQDGTQVLFHHKGWPEDNEHRRISNYCWAMYLRILKRHLEFGEKVPYEQRLEV